ncbi:MAG: VOC family protein [Cyclobacteriaceae bacterium]
MLKFHHVGVITQNMAFSIETYSKLFGKNSISDVYEISSQGVEVCFVETGKGSYLELVQSLSEKSIINSMSKKGTTYYHTGYLVPDIEEAISFLKSNKFRHIETFKSEAFDNSFCAFLISREAHLIELIEKN